MSITQFKLGQAIPLTDSLTIELIKARDLSEIITMLDDPEVAEYLFFAPSPVEVYQGFFNPIIANTAEAISKGQWPENITVVIRDLNGQYMGMAGLPAVMFMLGNFEVGYQLPVHAWGQGIATAACQFLTHLAFSELDAHKVTADCHISNTGSYKTMQKCGFVHEGRQKDYYKLANGFDDRVHYGITKAQFQAL
ncbi:GNAT family N-acetyltransferase [Shewanella marinintestina]|uniref:GNAT family N-acetyltransferase n=1 Tax=Shewanella marinintestina TaxID=190305 RepID=UPI00200DC05E|nr:GNAT family protein [Shewanella marinintestina]MCL1146559.1 GNAT family N-acetyltransferase [Shewanella marinintestina]